MLSLRENCQAKLNRTGPKISVGDVVIVRDDNTKRLFWRLAKVVELLVGKDGIARATLVNVSCRSGPPKILRRSTSHLIPIEVDTCAISNERSEVSVPEAESGDRVNSVELAQVPVDPEPSVHPRRNAAVLGEAVHKTWTNA